MSDEHETNSTSEWNYLNHLRKINRPLFGVVVVIMSVAAAFAAYRAYGFDNYWDLFVFVGFAVLLYCCAVLLKFIFGNETRATFFSAALLSALAISYVFGAWERVSDPTSGKSSPVILCWFGLPLCAQDQGEQIAVEVVTDDLDFIKPANEQNFVYVQFAGDISRDNEMKPFINNLVALGWTIPQYEKSGHRTGAAAGLNVVRYYFDQDKENAERLVSAVAASNPPAGAAVDLKLEFLDGKFDSKPGQLELWISN